jgi:hypothetical protein
MHTVTELNSFRRAATRAGMSDDDISDLVNFLSENPDAGDEISGTGGCRKVRFRMSENNKGKSGGVRTITLFSGKNLPVFLITAFGKSQKANLTKTERNQLKVIAETIVSEYARRIQELTKGSKS